MNNGDNHESKLWAILTREQLVDLSQFHRDGFFDEVPLYSRDSDVEFLVEDPNISADQTLIDFALKFLKSVVSYEKHRSSYFAAITVWPAPEGDLLVPNLFVWSGPIRKLQRSLVLDVPKTPFAKKIKQIVRANHAQNEFEVLEDSTTDPDESRVFISLAHTPYAHFVRMSRFVKAEATR